MAAKLSSKKFPPKNNLINDKLHLDGGVLARFRTTSLIVLFTDLTEGIVIQTDETHTLLKYSNTWIKYTDFECWEILPKNTKITVNIVQK